MKIALFVTGHLRNAPRNIEHYSQFLDGHETDVYVGTWSSPDYHRSTHKPIFSNEFNVEKDLQLMFGSYLKDAWIGDIVEFEEGRTTPPRLLWENFITKDKDPLGHTAPWPQRVMDQWYPVRRAYELCPNYDYYDIAIRIRGDMIFTGRELVPFADTYTKDGIHVNGYSWWTKPQDRENGSLADGTQLVPYALSDQLAWGKPKWLRKYFEYYDYFGSLFAGKINWEGRDGTTGRPGTFLFHSEHMMAYYLLKFPYYRCEINTWNNLGNEDIHDMPWNRYGRDFSYNYRPDGLYIDCDYYYMFKPNGTY